MTQQEITSMLENVEQKDIEQLFKYLRTQKAENAALAKGKTQKEIVQEYLNELAKLDPQLAAVYPTNNAGKSIDDCYQYIEDNARKMHRDGNCVSVTSYTVFEWAITYFLDESIAKFEVKKPTPVTTNYDPMGSKIKTLQANKTKWQEENDKKIQAWEIENNAKIDAFEKEHAHDLFPAQNPYTGKVNPYLDAKFPQQEELDKLIAEQKTKKTNKETEKDTDKDTSAPEPAAITSEPEPEETIEPEKEDDSDETGGELTFDEDNENEE